MKSRQLILTTICILGFTLSAFPLSVPEVGWVRIQSDNGEFSIEVPENFSYFFDADGFTIGYNQTDFAVRDMNLLNSYTDGTLLSLEIYRADPDSVKAFMHASDERGMRDRKTTFRGIRVRELTRTEDNTSDPGDRFYFVSRYFTSKEFVYVVSGLSRNGETPNMTRFFESLKFSPGSVSPLAGVRRLSELKVSPVDIKVVDAPPIPDKSDGVMPKPAAPDPDKRASILASKPRASYTKNARHNNVTGAVRLRLILAENGYIPKIDILRTLPEGLVRQSVFAALRLKFLPAEKKGRPVPIGKTLEYTFSIY